MASIELDRVSKVYPDGHVASRDLDLRVADGEFVVLVGPSGCGKSTALRMIAGLESPTRGRILIGGRDVTDVQPQDRDIAMVFQSYALYPHMTVRENLSFGLRMRKLDRREIDRRVERVADSMGLSSMLDRKPARLSGGQRQRVALGRALAREPVAFLLDEPLSNLDARLRVEMRAELARLHRHLETTMVYVTHDQEEAMTLGDRVAVLDDGALQQVAPPMELYRRPANRFVAGFIGSPEMNLYDGTLRAEGERARFQGEGFSVSAPRPGGVEAGAKVTLGIRPQNVEADGIDGDPVFATVSVVEPIGSQRIVHARTAAGERLVAVAPIDASFEEGSERRFRFPVGSIHLFDHATGARLG